MNDVTSPLGMLKGKPLSYFNALTKGYLQDPQNFQVSLGQSPQNFVVTIRPSTKVRILHNLFSVNTDPDTDASSTVVGIYGVNKVAPFKTITATGAVQALVPPRRVGSKKDQELRLPSSIQFAIVESADQFRDLVGDEDGEVVEELSKLPSSHFIHPQVFLDLEGKREWEVSDLACKIISLYEQDEEESDDDEDQEGPRNLSGVHQLLTFLWAAAKTCRNPVTLKEIPEEGYVTSICERKALAISNGPPGVIEGPQPQQGAARAAALAESQRLTSAKVLNLTKSSEAYTKQISKDDSSKSALSCLSPDQSALFNLLTSDNFETCGTPNLNDFTSKLTESRQGPHASHKHRQASDQPLGGIHQRQKSPPVPLLGIPCTRRQPRTRQHDEPPVRPPSRTAKVRRQEQCSHRQHESNVRGENLGRRLDQAVHQKAVLLT
jgi:hypothetical protein